MVTGILGKKLGMTQVFDEEGNLIPVTVIEAGPCVVTQIKTEETDKYQGVQVAYGDVKENKVIKPKKGHLAKSGAGAKKYLKELPFDSLDDLQLGQEIRADIFERGDMVKVTGVSKGKGFAGAVKRWHFRGACMTHGSMVHRRPQSGGATDAARTFKGVKRPGRMGGETVTQRGLTVFRVEPTRNLILVAGAVPGANGGILKIVKQTLGG